MSIVVEQTLPYTTTQLGLENPDRWSRLYPLLRPSIKVVENSNGDPVVLNTHYARDEGVLICAIGSSGAFASKLLNEPNLSAFTVENCKKIPSTEIVRLLKTNGFPVDNGVVVVKMSSTLSLKAGDSVMDVQVVEELQLDHLLALLSAAGQDKKSSIENTKALLEHFIKSATKTTSRFHEQKSGNAPFVFHAFEMSEFSSAKVAIGKDLTHLLSLKQSPSDSVYSVHYSDVNGLSRLENNILAHEISEYFATKNLKSYITQSTITPPDSQARGWAISLCPIPPTLLNPQARPTSSLTTDTQSTISASTPITSPLHFTDSQIRKIITSGCHSLIASEPLITKYDTIVGDGDCGYTLRDGAKVVIDFLARTPSLIPLPSTLSKLIDELEVNMGGTSGALYCIFLSALAQELCKAEKMSDAAEGALMVLLGFTRARRGDRTCLDCLIPFVEEWVKDQQGDLKKALEEARKGVEETEVMEARLGRSSYLDEEVTRGVPDPGAYGLLVLLEGMIKGM
ncbi:hypothetical protein ACMFMG_011603 [Clarireedia jacksonii]